MTYESEVANDNSLDGKVTTLSPPNNLYDLPPLVEDYSFIAPSYRDLYTEIERLLRYNLIVSK
jgi:hypothetical protein